MNLNRRLVLGLAVSGVLTILGVPVTQVALATQPVCQLWVTSQSTDHPTIIDGATLQTSTMSIGRTSWNVAMAPNGSKAYISTDTDIKVVNIASGYELRTINKASFVVATSPDGTKMYTAGWASGILDEFTTLDDGATSRTASVGRNPTDVAVSPNGAHLYVANYNSIPSSTITKIDLLSFTPTNHIVDSSYARPAGVAVSPDASKLYVVL